MERHTQKVEYLTWPVSQLDDRLYVELGDLVIIGGYPSAGKSAWALQCAWHWARKYKVGFFSLETSSEKLFDRQMSAIAQLSMDNIKLMMEIQQKTYTAERAYDYFCDEFENILQFIFGLKPTPDVVGVDNTSEKIMLRNAIITAAHKIYLDKLFAALRQTDA